MTKAEEIAESALRKAQQAVSLESVVASAVSLKAVEWVWPNRFAFGKFAILAGLPDRGKGLITADMTGRITNPKMNDWPCGEGRAPFGSVIMLSAEDDVEDTIVPRLIAAEADLHRVQIIRMAKRSDGTKHTFSLLTDLEALRAKIEQIGDVVMVVIDPVTSYLGVGKVNTFQGGDVRGVLMPLTELAMENHFLVLGIMHFNKKGEVNNALLRVSESLSFGAVARHVYAVTDDPANKRKLFIKAKNNLAPDTKALSYGISAKIVGRDQTSMKDIWAPHIVWGLEHVEISAVQAMEAENTGRAARNPRDEAKELLKRLLANGPMLQKDIQEAAEADDISQITLKRAKKDLGVKSGKNGMGGWQWFLPTTTTTGAEEDH
jgi:putative DNA primase/helicase